MTKKILVILGHPAEKSLCKKIAEEYVKEAKDSHFEVKRIYLSGLNFNAISKGFNERLELEPTIKQAQNMISWADHLVFIYPVWWGSMPALLHGFIERTFLPGFAFKYKENSYIPEKYLKGKSARVIMTTGGPKFYYYFNKTPFKVIKTFVLNFCGVKPVKKTLFGSIRNNMPKEKIEKILEKTRKLGKKGL